MPKPQFNTQHMLQEAEKYFGQIENYEEATVENFTKYLGVSARTVYISLPILQWKQLQYDWIHSRIKSAIEAVWKQSKTRKDFTLERVATYAKISVKTVRRFILEDEWQALWAMLPPGVGRCISQLPSSVSAQYVLQAEEYLASTNKYEAMTLKRFAEFLGEPVRIVSKRLPGYQWDILRNTWIEKNIKLAIDITYAEAKTQKDFSLRNIASHTTIPYTTIERFLSKDEWKARRATLPVTQEISLTYLLSQAKIYFEQTTNYKDVSKEKFAEFLGMPIGTFTKLFSREWNILRIKWIESHIEEAIGIIYNEARSTHEFSFERISIKTGIHRSTVKYYISNQKWQMHCNALALELSSRIRQAMDSTYAEAKTQEDFSVVKVARIANVLPGMISRLIGNEWQTRKATLPTTKEKVLATIQVLIDVKTPVGELTKKSVIELADVNGRIESWFDKAYFEACRQLSLHPRQEVIEPPYGVHIRIIPGGWIDIDSDNWDLKPAGGHLIQRRRLREDFSEIGWPILQRELKSPEIALSTIDLHYQGYIKASAVLGKEVPDIRRATLEAIQSAWIKFDGNQGPRANIRSCLVSVFKELMCIAEQDEKIDSKEMLRIFTWLRDNIVVGRSLPGEDFLSEEEVNAVIESCLTDVVAGIAYINENPDLLSISLSPSVQGNAYVVIQWATALMLLIMIFTGLRRESVINIKIDDWAEVHTELYILAWHHNKKVEENVTVLPTTLAQHLQLYVRCTMCIRRALETDLVFLSRNRQGHWIVPPIWHFREHLHQFIRRHQLVREGIPLNLGSNVLRRTYVTRALYEGRSLAALRSALGHTHLDSTARYAKSDRYEHPVEVGNALDEYGRKALTLWHSPTVLEELDSDERISLLGAKAKREQDVGLCRHNHCVKAIQGNPPPCSLCEHLVTGPEFLNAWNKEYHWRKQELEELITKPASETILAQMKYQFERFEANYAFLEKRFKI